MTSKEMLKATLPKDCIWENVAPLGSVPNWRIIPKPKGWGE
jgi:hypothetical protein